jgi:hypothetical protein
MSKTWLFRMLVGVAAALSLVAYMVVPTGSSSASSRVSSTASAKTRVKYIGAILKTASLWNAAYKTIGPLQSNKEFYDPAKNLPPSFKDSECAQLNHDPLCVIAYKTMNTNLKSFVQSIPPNRKSPVVMVYYQEVELAKNNVPASTFLKDFEDQSVKIREYAAAKKLTDVKVAMDSSTYEYGTPASGHSRGYSCSYIPPSRYVDYYLGDVYQSTLIGLQNDAEFQRWVHCVSDHGKPLGLGEYGLGVCVTHGTFHESDRAATLAADSAYLARTLPTLVLWEYWWQHQPGDTSKCEQWQFPANSVTAAKWRAIEAGSVSS